MVSFFPTFELRRDDEAHTLLLVVTIASAFLAKLPSAMPRDLISNGTISRDQEGGRGMFKDAEVVLTHQHLEGIVPTYRRQHDPQNANTPDQHAQSASQHQE